MSIEEKIAKPNNYNEKWSNHLTDLVNQYGEGPYPDSCPDKTWPNAPEGFGANWSFEKSSSLDEFFYNTLTKRFSV